MTEHDFLKEFIFSALGGVIPAVAILAGMKVQLAALKEYVHELKTDLHLRIDRHERTEHAPKT